jgi:hypothetical protein
MSYMNHDRGRRNIHISSPAPASVNPGYHKILGAVKLARTALPSWGSMGGDTSVEKMKGKLGGGPGRVWLITPAITGRNRRRSRRWSGGLHG